MEDPNQKSLLQVLIDSYKAGEPKGHLLMCFIDWMPIIFCPFGQAWYFNSVNKYGQETWYAPHNLYRQTFHFAGGLAIGAALGWLKAKEVDETAIATTFLAFGYLEFIIDIPQGKQWQKACLDTLFWTLGAASGCYMYFL